jgi:hypothetical protein
MAQLPQQPSALDPPEQSADRGTQPIAQATVSPKNIAVLLGGSMLFLIFVRGVGMVGKSDRSSRADTAGVISAPSTPTLDSARMHGPHMRVNVAVDGTKPNGLPWDGVRDAPDVGLCITAGAQTSCIPTATSERELHQPYCRDSNICRFENVVVPAGARVTIIDVDLIENDVIGTGFCSPNTACRIGAAQVVMTPVQDDLVTASSAPAESAFTTMTPLQHLAAARIAMASNYDPRTRTGGDLETAARHAQAISSSAREARQGAVVMREIESRRTRAQRLSERLSLAAARQMREELARTYDRRFIDRGIEVDSVRTTGPDATTLHINYALCGRVFINEVSRNDGDTLRGAGFRRVECESYLETAWVEL